MADTAVYVIKNNVNKQTIIGLDDFVIAISRFDIASNKLTFRNFLINFDFSLSENRKIS